MQTTIHKWRIRREKRKAQGKLTKEQVINMDYELLSDVNKRWQTRLGHKGISKGSVLE